MLLVFLVFMLIICINLLLIAYKDTKIPKEVVFIKNKKCLSVDKKASMMGKGSFWSVNFEDDKSYCSSYPLEVGKTYSFWYDARNNSIKVPTYIIKDCILLISLIALLVLLIVFEVILCTG